jgi:hypothetical protein
MADGGFGRERESPPPFEWEWRVFGVVKGPNGMIYSPMTIRTNYRPSRWKRWVMNFLIGSTWERSL